ncbi:hypothetical protein M2444_000693 [Paenibacillus sp. PastF-3]|uniref:hypothetical protein n=1 Tax=Paenibacillus TaxID=44249 RepID=UPI00247497B3|nr:hypothetical protein [Paenibacillus sp. PastF-3]MDH6368915.1 hypothetical protein [Paenibacillus sp. PastF-3]
MSNIKCLNTFVAKCNILAIIAMILLHRKEKLPSNVVSHSPPLFQEEVFYRDGQLFFGIVNGVFAALPIFVMKYKLSPDNYIVYSSMITFFLGIGLLLGSILGPRLIGRAL